MSYKHPSSMRVLYLWTVAPKARSYIDNAHVIGVGSSRKPYGKTLPILAALHVGRRHHFCAVSKMSNCSNPTSETDHDTPNKKTKGMLALHYYPKHGEGEGSGL